jgi:hypothetical protein
VCPDHTTTLESSPTDTRIELSYDQARSWTSLSWPTRRLCVFQFSTGGGSFVPAAPRQSKKRPALTGSVVHTECCCVRRRAAVELVDADDSVVGA